MRSTRFLSSSSTFTALFHEQRLQFLDTRIRVTNRKVESNRRFYDRVHYGRVKCLAERFDEFTFKERFHLAVAYLIDISTAVAGQ
jgi:hypothetical protein